MNEREAVKTEYSVSGESACDTEMNESDNGREPKPSDNPEADAQNKLKHLLFCGNERVELSAAKEILSMAEKNSDGGEIKLDVTIKIV